MEKENIINDIIDTIRASTNKIPCVTLLPENGEIGELIFDNETHP